MKETKALKEWQASEEFRLDSWSDSLLYGDIMYTQITRETHGVVKSLLPVLAGAVVAEDESVLGEEEGFAVALGSRLREVPRRRQYPIEELKAEYSRRRRRVARESGGAGWGVLSRDGWNYPNVEELIERRAFLLHRYFRQNPLTFQERFIRRISDERLLDAIIWDQIAPEEPSVHEGSWPWHVPMTWDDFNRSRGM